MTRKIYLLEECFRSLRENYFTSKRRANRAAKLLRAWEPGKSVRVVEFVRAPREGAETASQKEPKNK